LEDVEIVFHLAAFVSQPYNHLQNLQYEQVNRWGTLNLCRAIREQESIKKCIYLSSTAVFGFGNIENIHAQAAPTNAYGESKFHAEEYIKTLPDRCSAHILRSANVFGYNPCTRLDNILNKWIFSALTENKISIYGNGDQKRGFVPIHQVVDDLISSINTENTPGEPTTSMLFSASLNQLKNWLQSAIPSLEYRYLNRNQNFPSQKFPAYPFREEHQEVLNRHLEKMKSSISIVQ
jgi:UDP-glucose 4-epimerase